MGLDQLVAFMRRHRLVALDSSIFIYQVEANPRYVSLTDEIFASIEQPANRAVTSTITMTEVLVHPYRELDDRRVDKFWALLSTYPRLEWIPPSLEIADSAAQIRAVYGLRTPDALQAATAIITNATGLIANDTAFERVKTLESLILDRILRKSYRN